MKLFTQITAVLFGLLAGGMFLIALGLVPYWRSLEPAEFTSVFSTSLPTVGGTMIFLTILATGSITIAALIAAWKKYPARNWIIAAACCAIIMLITVPFYFGAANSVLSEGTLSSSEIIAELMTWQQMHWFRTILSVIGLFCVVKAGYVQPSLER